MPVSIVTLIKTLTSQEEMSDESVKCSALYCAPDFVTSECEASEDKLAFRLEGVDTGASYLWKISAILEFQYEFCIASCPSNLEKLNYY